jgi:hypothetical protein
MYPVLRALSQAYGVQVRPTLLYDTTGGMVHCLRTGLLKPWPVFSGTSLSLSLSLSLPHVHEQTSITAYSLECLTPLL